MSDRALWDRMATTVLHTVDSWAWAEENLDGAVRKYGHMFVLCLYHDDEDADLDIHRDGTFDCDCGAQGTIIDLCQKAYGISREDAILQLLESAETSSGTDPEGRPPISKTKVRAWHRHLLEHNAPLVRELQQGWGINRASIMRHEIGWSGGSYTFPIWDTDGTVVNVKLMLQSGKIRNYYRKTRAGMVQYGNPPRLYGIRRLVREPAETPVFCVESELERILLLQVMPRVVAVAGTRGFRNWQRAWAPHFADRDVVVLCRASPNGYRGGVSVCRLLAATVRKLRIVQLPPDPDCVTLLDWVQLGRTGEELGALVDKASPLDTSGDISIVDNYSDDESDFDFIVHRVTVYYGKPTRIIMDISPSGRPRGMLEVTMDDLHAVSRFEQAFAEAFGRFPVGLPRSKMWLRTINGWLDQAKCTGRKRLQTTAEARIAVLETLEKLPRGSGHEGLKAGAIVTLPNGKHAVSPSALHEIICREYGETPMRFFWAALKSLGMEKGQIRFGKAVDRYWTLAVPGECIGDDNDQE